MEIHAPVILFNYYRLFRRRLDGRNGPSSPVIANGAMALRFSGPQPINCLSIHRFVNN